MNKFISRFHTKVSAAMGDASTWPSLAAVLGGAVSVPPPYGYGVILFGVIGVIMKGGQNVSSDKLDSKDSGPGQP